MPYLVARSLATGRASSGFINELDKHVRNGSANVFPILREIESLEGLRPQQPTQTKAAKLLRGKKLRGLWHKHYMQASFLAGNLSNHWAKPAHLEQAIRAVWREGEQVTFGLIRELSNALVHGGLADRRERRKLTGEWIIFAKHAGKNYYLTLGKHGEDDAIWARARQCREEFVELRVLQEDR